MENRKSLKARIKSPILGAGQMEYIGNAIIFTNNGGADCLIDQGYILRVGASVMIGLQEDSSIMGQTFLFQFVGIDGFVLDYFNPFSPAEKPRVDVIVLQTEDAYTAQYTQK